MDRADIGHYANVRKGNIAQEGDLAGNVKSHFENGALMARAQLQHGEWKSDFVVEVAGAFERAVARAQYFGDNFLGRRLAHAARNTDHSQIKFAAPVTRDLLKRSDGVVNAQAHRRDEVLAAERIGR